MKKLLLFTLFVPSVIAAITDDACHQLADMVYTNYMRGLIEHLNHNNDRDEFDDYVDICKNRSDYKELRALLEQSFAAETIDEARTIAQPVILFATSLQTKLTNTERMAADFNVTDQAMLDQLAVAASSQLAYFEALKAYSLEHAFLYTFTPTTQTQQEIDQATTYIADLLCSTLTIPKNNIKAFPAEWQQRLSKLKKSSFMKSLQREIDKSHKEKSWAASEKAAPRVRLFIQLLELKLTNKPAIYKKNNINTVEMRRYCNGILDTLNLQRIVQELGLKGL